MAALSDFHDSTSPASADTPYNFFARVWSSYFINGYQETLLQRMHEFELSAQSLVPIPDHSMGNHVIRYSRSTNDMEAHLVHVPSSSH